MSGFRWGKGDVLEMWYVRKEDGAGAWVAKDWSYGELGEWDAFAQFE